MIVYVESNFALELAFLQEESEECSELLRLAQAQRTQLVFPTFCIAEPYETLVRRSRDRDALQTRLSRELAEIGRSKPYQEIVEGSGELIGLLGRSADEAKLRLEDALRSILELAQLIPVDSSLFAHALELQPSRSLSPQDAIVYASVLRHLSTASAGPKCFLNRNSKDFFTPDIDADLSARDCRIIPSFKDGLAFIKSQIRTE
jgi:predicted nucleic acid-binding protein